MTAKQLKAKAPFFWQAVEAHVYEDCISVAWHANVERRRALTDTELRRIAHNAAFIATSEFVSRAGK